MNVLYALLIMMLCGAIAGAIHGLMVYDGFTAWGKQDPKKIKASDDSEITVTVFTPGTIGHALIGAVAGVMVFCGTHHALVLSYNTPFSVTLADVLAALAIGLGGSAGLNAWIDNKDLLGIQEKPMPDDNVNQVQGAPGQAQNNPPVPPAVERSVVVITGTPQQPIVTPLSSAAQLPHKRLFANPAYDLYRALES